MLNYEKTGKHAERITKIKPFEKEGTNNVSFRKKWLEKIWEK